MPAPMKVLKLLTSLLLLSASFDCDAQEVTTKAWMDLVLKAQDHYFQKSYDSSLYYCDIAIRWGAKNYRNNPLYSRVLIVAGDCYKKKSLLVESHDHYTAAYSNALYYKHGDEEVESFTSLNQLHSEILKKDLPFPYKPFITTVTEQIVLQVEKVQPAGDSLLVIVYGGSTDGVVDSLGKASIYSRYVSRKDSAAKRFGFIKNGRIGHITPNRTMIILPKAEVQPGDLAFVNAQVPIHLNNSAFKKQLLFGLFVNDNARQRIYDRRYFEYFFSEHADSSVTRILKNSLDEVVTMIGGDTLSDKTFLTTIQSGIFAGMNVLTAMHRSGFDDIRYFNHFLFEYPANYIGNDYKFSEIYATWVINNTPLLKSDILPLLAKAKKTEERKRLIYNLRSQIAENNLPGQWIQEALTNINADNISDAQTTAGILKETALVSEVKNYSGWTYYINALCADKNDDTIAADRWLKDALAAFEQTHDYEGELWAQGTLASKTENKKVRFSVQSGHLAPYEIAMSPHSGYFATGSEDFLIKIWDINQGKEIKTLPGHTDEVKAISYSPDGKYLASASLDSTIRIWNAFDYTPVRIIKTNLPQTIIKFTPDGKQLASAGRDSLIRLWDPVMGNLLSVFPKRHKARITDLCFDPTNSNTLLSSSYDSLILEWDMKTKDTVGWFREKARVLSVKVSEDGKYMSTVSTNRMMNVWNYETRKLYFRDSIATHLSGTSRYYSQEAFSPDSRYIVHSAPNEQMTITDLNSLKRISYHTDKREFLSAVHFSNDGNFLIQKFFLGGKNNIIDFSNWNFDSQLNSKLWKVYNNPPMLVQFSNDGKKLFISSSYNSAFDFSDGSTELLYYGGQAIHNRYWKNNDQQSVYVYDSSMLIRHLGTKKDIATYGLGVREKIESLHFAWNDSICYLAGNGGTITAWDLKSNKIVFSKKYHQPMDSGIKRITADTIKQRVYFTTGSGKIYTADAFTGNKIDSVIVDGSLEIATTGAAVYTGGAYSSLYKLDPGDLHLVKKVVLRNDNIPASFMALSPDKKYIALSGVSNHYLSLVNVLNDSIIYSIYDHDFAGGQVSISPDNALIATGGFDNKVNIYELQGGKLIGSVHTPLDEDYVLSDREGHYMAPKKSLDGIVFNFKNTAFNYEQFDLQFNRPDIVLTNFGKADPELIKSYNEAYKKRIKKLGLTEDQVKIDVHLPISRILDRYNAKPATSDSVYEMRIECYDSKYALQALHVIVNNIPLFGMKGKPLSGERTEEKVRIPLSQGDNIIKVYCTNDKSAASLRSYFSVYCTRKPSTEPKTYFIGIAVAGYKDSGMNLTYSAKDVRDLAATFKKLYPNAIIDTLINKQATKENILKLRSTLIKTSPHDKVIMAVTGHGLLSDSLDFYYATYDVNFSKPDERGLKYEELENLLNDIPSRQKLLLIDACHSGALDKDELLTKNVLQKGNVKVANARSSIKIKKSKLKLNSTFELMQNQFADLSNNSGTVVISAAGGLEYAFESARWNNGVFTYCIRKALEEDYKFSRLTVQELQQYVSKAVSALTNGQQKPTSRKENLDYDWAIK
jgi:WD40 repeat protein